MPTSLHGKTHGTVGAAQHGLSAVLGRRPCPAWWSALHALPQRRERCRSVAAWSRIAEFEAEVRSKAQQDIAALQNIEIFLGK
jgi:hypothetical protein